MKISAVIITQNSEEYLADCLESIAFCDEIVVIDSGSTDRTVEIAKHLKAKVHVFETDDFSQMRNFGLEKAKSDWVLYIDSDERVTPELAQNIKNQTSISKKNYIGAYYVQRKNFYLGNNEWPQIEQLERLFRKEKLKGWYGKLHESPSFEGEIGLLDGFLLHYTHRDLSSMVAKTVRWSDIEAKLRFESGHPKMSWWRFPRVMSTAFFNSYIKQKGWKLGTVGFIESMYQSFSIFITYAKLWEKQQKNK